MDSAARSTHYAFDNSAPQAGDRFANLSALYDEVTCRHLDRLGIAAGSCCLEVGAGGGSIARFMSERLGAAGHVVATDINTDWITRPLPTNVELRHHDIGVDPLPEASFDVIHARAVLTFVPQRRTALQRTIAALKPGGWLLIEELLPPITEAWDRPDDPGVALARKARLAIMEMVRRGGGDLAFAQELPFCLRAARLADVGAEGYFVPYRTDAVLGLAKANIDQLAGEIVAAGLMDPAELARYREILARPDCFYPASMALISVWGRRQLA
ncbi:MAG TPA: methyltransferase domain-containing protein [Mycobacterium sp.]|nr:methyltransferase domain-containing protein [Mycobacterium sp.]